MVDRLQGKRLIAETRLKRNELKIERAIKKALAVHKVKAIASLKAQHITAAAPVDAFDFVAWDTSVTDEALPVIDGVLRDFSSQVTNFLKLPPEIRSEILGRVDVLSRAEVFADRVRTIGPDVARAVTDELQIGVANGESIPQLTKRLDDAFEVGDRIAERIARTETHGAAEGTSFDAASAINQVVPVTKSYIATQDDRTRPEHLQAEEDNQNIPVDQPFIVGGYECDFPGNTGEPSIDINCRCSTTYDSPIDEG